MLHLKSFFKNILGSLGVHVKEVDVKGGFGKFKDELTNLLKSFIDFKNIRKNNLNLALKFLERGNVKDAMLRFRIMSFFNKRDLDSRYYIAYCYLLSGKRFTAYSILISLKEFEKSFKGNPGFIFTKDAESEELINAIENDKAKEVIKKYRDGLRESFVNSVEESGSVVIASSNTMDIKTDVSAGEQEGILKEEARDRGVILSSKE